MGDNLVFVLVAVGSLLVVWTLIGLVVARLWHTFRRDEHLWYYEWEDIDYDRQEDFCQKDEYRNGR